MSNSKTDNNKNNRSKPTHHTQLHYSAKFYLVFNLITQLQLSNLLTVQRKRNEVKNSDIIWGVCRGEEKDYFFKVTTKRRTKREKVVDERKKCKAFL